MSISVDVDIDDILWGMGSRDQEEMLEGLLDDMDVENVLRIIHNHEDYKGEAHTIRSTIYGDDTSFTAACAKIDANRWRLPLDQEQLILQIADKL
jgi:hypothetical protein